MNTAKHHTTIKMKAIDIKSSTYISFGVNNDSYPKFETSDHFRISY